MIEAGLLEEVQRLVEDGFGWDLPALSGLGYIQFRPYLAGAATLEEAVAEIKRATRRFIRHQYNWFRLNDSRIHWFHVTEEGVEEIEAFIGEWLQERTTAESAE